MFKQSSYSDTAGTKFLFCLFVIFLTSSSTLSAFAEPNSGSNAPFVKLAGALGGYNTTLDLKIWSQRRCMMGDIDLIKLDAKRNPKKSAKLLLTLERLGQEEVEKGGNSVTETKSDKFTGILARELPGVDALEGYTTSLAIPSSSEPVPYALYICNDSTGDGRCGSKAPAAMQKLAAVDANVGATNVVRTAMKKDKIYYYQLILISSSGLEVLKPARKKTQQLIDEVKAHLSRTARNIKNPQDIARHAVDTNSKVDSMPLELERRTIKINLPRLDDKLCKENE